MLQRNVVTCHTCFLPGSMLISLLVTTCMPKARVATKEFNGSGLSKRGQKFSIFNVQVENEDGVRDLDEEKPVDDNTVIQFPKTILNIYSYENRNPDLKRLGR